MPSLEERVDELEKVVMMLLTENLIEKETQEYFATRGIDASDLSEEELQEHFLKMLNSPEMAERVKEYGIENFRAE